MKDKIRNIICDLRNIKSQTLLQKEKDYIDGQISVYKEWLDFLETNVENNYKVIIIESERDYGQKIDEIKYFESEEIAKKFVNEFNSKNNLTKTPDWYMYAEYKGKIK